MLGLILTMRTLERLDNGWVKRFKSRTCGTNVDAVVGQPLTEAVDNYLSRWIP